MERKAKITIAKMAVVVGAIPLLLWAYEYGPNPGYCGVPNENSTCTAAGCHTGTTNDPANTGSVTIGFPNGMTYTPGVAQLLTVTISDPATTQQAWGFQLTPRLASNTATMAGTLASTDTHTALMCSQANLFIFEAVCLPGADPLGRCQQMSAPACPPADTALQYMEHSYTGYLSTMGTGSGTYQFTWTPPATNVGNITFYVAGDAGVGGPPTQNADHVYATTYTLTPFAVSPPAATLSISKTHTGNFTQGQQGVTYTVTVSNGAPGGATTGLVTVTDTIPAGLTLASMSGTGWSCSSNTCTRSDVLNPGSRYPPIAVTVNVAANAASPQVNSVSVSGGGSVTAVTTDSTAIDNQLVITPASLPGGMVGVPYLATVNVTGGLGPYTWSDLNIACPQVCVVGLGCTFCTLPVGLTRTFGPTTVTISGTPTTVGQFDFGFQVTDSNLATATQRYEVTIAPPCSITLNPTSASLPATGTSTVETCPNNSGQPNCGVAPETPLAFTVTPIGACGVWTAASSNPGVVQITSGGVPSGPGSGVDTVDFAVLNNTHTGPQSYTITVASGAAAASYSVTETGSGDSEVYREVYALYEQLLFRDPDRAGFAFWTGAGGAGLGQMADSFLTSPEAYNSDFAVMAAYQAAMSVLPSYAQFTAAVTSLRAGTQTVGGLFSSMIGSGFTATTLYEELLNRQPSASELAACNDAGLPLCFEALIGYPGTTTPISAPNSGFQITNASYVRMLYYVILGRDPDPAGLAFWLGVANSCGPGIYFQGSAGYSCRIQILGPGTPNQGFIGSPEFQGLFAN